MDSETVAPEPTAEIAKPYSWKQSLLAIIILPVLLLLLTSGAVALIQSAGSGIDRSLTFLLSSSTFLVAAFIYILITGRLKTIWSFLKLDSFKWVYIPIGLGAAVCVYIVAILVGMISVLITQLSGAEELGSNSTSEVIGELAQSHSLLFIGFVVAIFAPLAEEIFFRGALLGSLVQDSKSRWIRFAAVAVVSVIFALFHMQEATGTMADVLAVVTPGLVGLAAAILTLWFNSLYPAIFTHLFYNGAVTLIIALSAS